GDVYSTKQILAGTHVSVMRKYRYGYLEEIVVRRADNDLYRFKEGDDVVDFTIALRMYTRSFVIQRQVKDLQLGVESCQKQINVTKPDTTDLISKKAPTSFFARRHNKEHRHDVLAKEKVEQLGKEKISFHDQRHQQAAKGKKDDEEFGEIHRW
ncbi:hypothetical protein Tco_1324553, partial [Tanacetum coccineum]